MGLGNVLAGAVRRAASAPGVAATITVMPLLLHPCPAAAATASQIAQVRTAEKAAYAIAASTNGCPRSDAFEGRGWSGSVVRSCEYAMADKALGRPRAALAYLLEVDPAAIAAWIASACDQLIVKQSRCFGTLLSMAKANSGMMFPIAGNIVEDMDRPGVFKNYFFKNGMTVSPVPHVNGGAAEMPLTRQDELARSSVADLASIPSGMTRYWGTTPDQFRRRFPALDAPERLNRGDANARWLRVARTQMRAALQSHRNRLLEAYLCANAPSLFRTSCVPPQP